MFRFVIPLVLVALLPVAVIAQDTTPVEPPAPHVSLAWGGHFGTPLRASLALGALFDVSPHSNDGTIAMVEVGEEGNEISAGYFRMIGRYGSGYSLRAAVVRTGDEPWNASANTTYIGVEAHWMLVFGVGGQVGFLRRASQSVNDPHNSLVSFGVSIGH
jgi:hypothetical protein